MTAIGGLIAMMVIALIMGAPSASGAEVLDRVMAVANGEVILLSDVKAAQRLSLLGPAIVEAGDAATVAALIDRALMLDEVNRYAPPEPSGDEIRAAVDTVRARFASGDAFNQVLAEVGMNESRLAEYLHQTLRIRAYLDQRFTTDTPARSEEAVTEWLASLRRRATIVDRSGEK